MRDRKRGTIINVASTAGFQAVPYMATYAATKAFVLSFSEALWEENRAHGVHVMALSRRDGNKLLRSCRNRSSTDAHDPNAGRSSRNCVARVATRKSTVISGWTNFLTVEAERFFPRSFVTKVAGKALRSRFEE